METAAPLLVMVLLVMGIAVENTGAQTWCVARFNMGEKQLQTALDYACGAGADCVPIQSSGLCFLPNTLQAHASYAFNSYYQRRSRAPGSCDFSGSANIAATDPSYGSCVYPSSSSSAGGGPSTPLPPLLPSPGVYPISPPNGLPLTPGGIAGLTPGVVPDTPGADGSDSPLLRHSMSMIFCCLFITCILLVF